MSTYTASTVQVVAESSRAKVSSVVRGGDRWLARLADRPLPDTHRIEELLAACEQFEQRALTGKTVEVGELRTHLDALESLDPHLASTTCLQPGRLAQLDALRHRAPDAVGLVGASGLDARAAVSELREAAEVLHRASAIDRRLTTAHLVAEALQVSGYHVSTHHLPGVTGLAGLRHGEVVGIQLHDDASVLLDFAGCDDGACVDRLAEIEQALDGTGIRLSNQRQVRHDDRRGGALLGVAGPQARAITPEALAESIAGTEVGPAHPARRAASTPARARARRGAQRGLA